VFINWSIRSDIVDKPACATPLVVTAIQHTRASNSAQGTHHASRDDNDHLPQEGPDETHVRVKGSRPQVAGVLTRCVFWGTTGVCHRAHLLPVRLFLIFNITEESAVSGQELEEITGY
jgi:hypothetical protein